VVASYLAVYREDKLTAALAGLLHYELAAERAESNCKGPGTFIPCFLDELYALGQEVKQGKNAIQAQDLKLEWL
jgi:thiamine-phosphate diphosphorylase/hydroxyethylthiazole kinase